MRKEIHHIDEYFAEGLGNMEFNPPADVWENIEKELDRKRRVRILTIWTSMAAGLALFMSIGIYVLNNNINSTKHLAALPKTESQNRNTVSSISKTNDYSTKKSALAKSAYSNQSQAMVKKSSETNSGIHSVIINNNDNTANIKNTEDNENSSSQTITAPDTGIDIANNTSVNRATDQPNYIESKQTQLENNVTVTPLVSNDKPLNNNIASKIESVDPFLQFGETNTQEKAKIKHWSLEGQVAPQYSYRNISDMKGNTPSKQQYNKSEDGLVAYGGGFKVSYQTGKRLSIQAGVFYSVMGQTMNNVYEVRDQSGMAAYAYDAGNSKSAYWVPNSFGSITTPDSKPTPSDQINTLSSSNVYYTSIYVNKASGSVLKAVPSTQGTLLDNAQIIQQLKFIEIPFLARYKIIDKKIGCHIVGGVSTNMLVNSDVVLKQNGSKENIGETSNLRRMNYSGSIGLGINYQWFKKVSLSIEPTYKYYLNSISDNENMKVHPYSFGIFTGLVYKF